MLAVVECHMRNAVRLSPSHKMKSNCPQRARLQDTPGQALSLDGWPSEGHTLCAILRQLVSPQSWSELTERTGEKWPGLRGHSSLGPVRLGLGELDWAAVAEHPRKALIAAIRECQPLIDKWNSGALFAKGRRKDPLSPDMEIRPPTNWELWVVDFSSSTIADPMGDGTKIYDLRFYLAESRPINNTSGPERFRTGAPGRPTAAHFIKQEAERRISAGEVTVEAGGLKKFAKELEAWWSNERQRYEQAPTMTATTIANTIRELWNESLARK